MPKLIKILSIIVSIGIAVSSLAFLTFAKPVAPPTPGFTDFDFRGDYAFAGQTDASGGVLATGGVIGRFTADGHGHMTDGIITLAGGGESHHESLTCNYVVDANGTGRMTCATQKLDGPDIGSTATGTNDFVLVDGGREFYSVNTNVGEVQGFVSTGKRQ